MLQKSRRVFAVNLGEYLHNNVEEYLCKIFGLYLRGKKQNITLCPLAVDGRERCTQAGKRGTASVRKEIRQDCISLAKFSGRSFSFLDEVGQRLFFHANDAAYMPAMRRRRWG